MKHLKLFENFNEFNNDILLDEDTAISYLKSINFFEDHGFDDDDEGIIDNISDICYNYRRTYSRQDSVEIYRMIEVPSIDYIDFNQIGYSWSFKRDGVGTYDAGVSNQFNKNWERKETKDIVLTAIAKTKDINWKGTLIANAIYGDEQSECEMSKGSELIITHINDEELDSKIKSIV